MKEKIILRNLLEINLKNIKANLRLIKKKVYPQKVMGVIKANAYGMGYKKILEVFKECEINNVAVSCLQEAYEVRKIFKGNLYLLGDFLKEEISLLIDLRVNVPLTNYESARCLNRIAQKKNKQVAVQVYVDTGMGNLGVLYSESLALIEKILSLKQLKIKGIFSHFPHADKKNDPLAQKQIQQLKKVGDQIKKFLKREDVKIHLANSDGVFNYPNNNFDLVRVGISLYGVSRRFIAEGLKPSLSFKSKLISKKTISAPYSIGYARTYHLKKTTVVGTVSAGYADGLPFALSNKGRVLIKGKSYPIIGRLSMDYLTIDLLNDGAKVKVGDEVVLLGYQKFFKEPILVEEWSNLKKTHPYDILCSFGSRRLDKIYIQ